MQNQYTCPGCLAGALVAWDIPRSDKRTASIMGRLPPDLGQPRLPAPPSFPVLAELVAGLVSVPNALAREQPTGLGLLCPWITEAM